MSDLNSCPHCNRPVVIGDEQCTYCHENLHDKNVKEIANSTLNNSPINYEPQTPNLGEFLLNKGLIKKIDLEKALAIQEEQAVGSQRQLLGQILIDQGLIDQNTLNQVILEQLLSLQTALVATEQQVEHTNKVPNVLTELGHNQINSSAQITLDAISIITHADSKEQILDGLVKIFLDVPFTSAILLSERKGFAVIQTTTTQTSIPKFPRWLSLHPNCLIKYLNPLNPLLIFDLDDPPELPDELMDILHQLGHKHIALLPVIVAMNAVATIIFASHDSGAINISNLKAYIDIAKLFSKTLEGISNTETMQRRLSVMQSLDAINQSIAGETEIDRLFQVIHDQISEVVGDVNLLIALYDKEDETIKIPYAYEDKQLLSIQPFPLGEGLTSIIINTGQPLKLDENAESRAQEMGAKVVGTPAKSFLGVPLIVAGDVIGALIIQDNHTEYRFDEEDQHFLIILASQVAISIRNLIMLEEIQGKAERDRIVSGITAKFWASSDVETIMRTAIMELGRTLKASKGLIQLKVDESGIETMDIESV
jgi:GAF domain-containing protein